MKFWILKVTDVEYRMLQATNSYCKYIICIHVKYMHRILFSTRCFLSNIMELMLDHHHLQHQFVDPSWVLSTWHIPRHRRNVCWGSVLGPQKNMTHPNTDLRRCFPGCLGYTKKNTCFRWIWSNLFGGFNPFEKYESKWESSPIGGEN